MSKGPKTQTLRETNTVPAYVEDAQKALLGAGKTITDPFLQTAPNYTVAGFTPDQIIGFDLTRGMAEDAFMTPRPTVPNTSTLNQFSIPNANITTPARLSSPALMSSHGAGLPASIGTRSAGLPASTTASLVDASQGQVTGSKITDLLNPYTKDVLDPTLDILRRERDRTRADIGARSASSAAFGGSRQALQDAELDRSYGDTVALTTGDLMSKGYDQATRTALANADSAQRAGLFNAGAQNAASDFNAAAANDFAKYNTTLGYNIDSANAAAANDFAKYNTDMAYRVNAANAGALNRADELNAGYTQSANLANQQAVNDMLRSFYTQRNTMVGQDADRALTGTNLENTFVNDQQRRQLAALAGLLGTGGQQQKLAQEALDQPIEMLKLLGQITPNQTSSNTTKQVPDNSPSTLQTLGGLASTAASIFSMFSDENEKTNKQKLGKDPETGLDLYAYDYKADVAKAKRTGKPMPPKRVGPMAGDIEKKMPGATRKIGGKRIVRNLGMGG